MATRRIALTLAIVSVCLSALGQGKVTFGNDSNHLFVLIGGPLPVSPLPDGSSLMAVLYAGTSSGNLWLQTSIVLDAAGMPMEGRMANKPVILTNVPGGAVANFQIFVTDAGVALPSSIVGGYNHFVGATYFGTSGLFTAIPGTSLSYPNLATSASASTWAPGPLQVGFCELCVPPVFSVYPSNAVVTLGGDVTLTAEARSFLFMGVRYQWRKQGSPIIGATNASLTLTSVALSDAGNYNVEASNSYGSRVSPIATLTVFIPTIAATLGSPSYTTNNRFQFTVTGTAGTNYIVQVSTNLATADWVSLFTNASPFTFVDTNANSFPQEFYRAYAP